MRSVGCREDCISRNRIEDFGPYQDAVRLFDQVVDDMQILQKDPRCYRLIGQQVGSADSICANMDEGFGRLSRKEFIRFLDISRGSARETLGRYKRFKHWLPEELVEARVQLADRIIARLTKTIATLRESNASGGDCRARPRSGTDTPNGNRVKEMPAAYIVRQDEPDDALTNEDLVQLLRID